MFGSSKHVALALLTVFGIPYFLPNDVGFPLTKIFPYPLSIVIDNDSRGSVLEMLCEMIACTIIIFG